MRWSLTLFTGLFVALLLAGCSDGGHRRIGFSQCSHDEWRIKMNNEVMRSAVLLGNYDVELACAYDNVERQREQLEEFIAEKVDLIACAPMEIDALVPTLRKAMLAGIPVVVFDRQPSEVCYTAQIGADNYTIGRAAAQWLKAHAAERQLNVLEVRGSAGSSAAIGRAEGFAAELRNASNITVVDSLDGLWGEQGACAVVDSFLRSNNQHIDYIFAHNDRMAFGAYRALNAHPDRANVHLLGIDGLSSTNPDELASYIYGANLVSEHIIDATFLYPTGGDRLMDLADRILSGKPYKQSNPLPTSVVDSTNVALYMLQRSEMDNLDRDLASVSSYVGHYTTVLRITTICLILTSLAVGALLVFFHRRRREGQRLLTQNAELKENVEQITLLKQALEQQTRDAQAQTLEAQAQAQAIRADTKAKLDFFTNVSHDIRTPLALVSGPIEQLAQQPEPAPEERHRLLQLAQRYIAVVARLVNQIIDVRRRDAGALSVNASSFNLSNSLALWMEGFRQLSYKRGIGIRLTVPDNLSVHLDSEKTERIFFNLMSNAFKHTPEGGHINVNVTETPGQITLTIADTGPGIPEAQRSKIFEQFYVAGDPVAGAGLGLLS